MPEARCKPGSRGGLIVVAGRPFDIKPGWQTHVPPAFLDGRYSFLEAVPVPALEVGNPGDDFPR